MTMRDRAALALDMTHFTNKGVYTPKVREILARYLDGATKLRISTVRAHVKYLEMIARS